MIRFENIYLLAGLGLVMVLLGLFSMVQRWKKKTAEKIGDPLLVASLTKNYSSSLFTAKVLIACIALVLLILAVANPQTRGASQPVSRKGLDVMILMDVSKSMLAQDIKPSRLERSKQLVSLLIDRLADNRIGMIWFAGRAYIQMPLSTDASAAKLYLQNAGPDAVPTQGTVIGEALKMAGSAFNSQDKKFKAVILISDGEDHDPEAMTVAKQLAANGVMINTVGVGSNEGTTILDPATNDSKRDAQGNLVVTKLNETQLRELARTGNGAYTYLQDANASIKTIESQLATVDQKQLEDSSFIQYNSYFYYFLALVLLLLVLEVFIPERKKMVA